MLVMSHRGTGSEVQGCGCGMMAAADEDGPAATPCLQPIDIISTSMAFNFVS